MKTNDLLLYLEELTKEYLTPFLGEIYWQKKQQRIEIYGSIFTENKNHLPIVDVDDLSSNEEILEFSDGICFYEEKYPVQKEEFLAAFPFKRKVGLTKGEMKAAVLYFADILKEGEVELAKFLTESDEETFSLKFDHKKYLTYLKTYEDDTYLPYPKF